jgi:hypothetical protein
MAIRNNIQFKGISIKDAYLKVQSFEGDKFRLGFTLVFKSNANSEIFNKESYEVDYNMEGENPIVQAYNYLKTLPEFSASVDV